MYKYRVFVIVVVVIFVLDRTLKYYAQTLSQGEVFSLGRIFEFGYFLNPSLFFLPAWGFISWLALVVLIILTVSAFHIQDSIFRSNIFPIILGGASNVFDRFAYGGVIDYVYIPRLATINLADILILIGLVGLLLKNEKTKL